MVLYTKIDKNDFLEEKSLIKFISDDRQDFVRRNKNDKVKLASLYAELLLRYGLNQYYNITDELIFDRHDDGKPYLSNHSDIEFNISHTSDMVMCGISDKGSIGVDVEHIRKVNKRTALKIFSSNEIAYVNDSDDISQTRFLEIWTKKEAYTKYLGTGLRYNLTEIDMLSDEHSSKLLYEYKENHFLSVYSDEIHTDICRVDIQKLQDFFISK